MTKPILVIDTGGTIGSSILADGRLGHRGPSASQELLTDISAAEGVAIRRHAFRPAGKTLMDSAEITLRDWSALATTILQMAPECGAAVILHGTDTMSFTACALTFALGSIDLPIVLTGAQRSAQEEGSDAAANIRLALEVAVGRHGDFAGEVVVAFGGLILRGSRTRKVDVSAACAFASPSLPTIRAGLPASDAAWAHWRGSAPKTRRPARPVFDEQVWMADLWPSIAEDRLERAIQAAAPKGVVWRLGGAGVSPPSANLPAICRRLNERGILTLAVSNVAGGMLDLDRYENSRGLARSGLLNGRNMTPEAALVKMMWVLGAFEDDADRRRWIEANVGGELDDFTP